MTLFIATDFSDGSDIALKYALQQPDAADGVFIHHAIDAFDDELWTLLAETPAELETRLLEQTTQSVQSWTEGKLKDSAVKKVNFLSSIGPAAAEVAELAKKKGVDRVISGSTGHGKVMDFLVGATAVRIARESEIPVTVVNKHTGPAKTLLVPYDFSDRCGIALDWAYKYAERLGANVLIIHSIPTGEPLAVSDELEEMHKVWLAARREQFEELISDAPVDVDFQIEFGPAHVAILDAAERTPDCEVVIASHKRGALGRLALGSVTERVLRKCPVPTTVL